MIGFCSRLPFWKNILMIDLFIKNTRQLIGIDIESNAGKDSLQGLAVETVSSWQIIWRVWCWVIIKMSSQQSSYKIVGSRNSHLIVTSKSFEKFIVHQFPYSLRLSDIHSKLVLSDSQSLLPVSTHNLTPPSTVSSQILEPSVTPSRIRIVTKFYESTLEDMMGRRGTFEEDQLQNTLSLVLELLQDLSDRNSTYGMLKPSTVCFCEGDIKLGFGEVLEREVGETYLEADLKSLGEMILKLATDAGQQTKQLLRIAEKRYSLNLTGAIRRLIDPISKNRKSVFGASNQSQTLPQKKHVTLSQLNASNGPETASEKIQRINNIVNECLKRSRRVLERSERKDRIEISENNRAK